MHARGCRSSSIHGQAPSPAQPAPQLKPKVLRRYVIGLLPTLIAVPAAKADEGTVTLINKAENLSGYQAQVLEYNLRIQRQNNAPAGFPSFIRDKFDIAVIAEGYSITPEGLIYKDFKLGEGTPPADGEQVTFQYTAYNESGRLIDTTYRQDRPAETRLGINGLIPGFELGLKTMLPGGQRRIVVPPDLGPPVGPSTFFSAKQCEVFDVELLGVKTCRREGALMFSKVVCGGVDDIEEENTVPVTSTFDTKEHQHEQQYNISRTASGA